MQLEVNPCTNILGGTTWVNHLLDEGSGVVLVFFLGEIVPGGFRFYYFTYDGVNYYIGSAIGDMTPARDMSKITNIPSHATFENPSGLAYWDAVAGVGFLTGNVRVVMVDNRVVGLCMDDVHAYLKLYHWNLFDNVLKVTRSAEVTAFAFARG